MRQKQQSLIDHLQAMLDAHRDLIADAKERKWPVAEEYHTYRAGQYLARINAILKQKGGDKGELEGYSELSELQMGEEVREHG